MQTAKLHGLIFYFMTHEQIMLVKRSWSILQKVDPALVADVFYSKLFADKPSLRRMFPINMTDQYRKIIDMINVVVSRLDRIDELTDDIAAMAERHVGYGVKNVHYALVGNALLWTLEKGLGKDWTTDVKAAWAACYQLLTDVMVKQSHTI